MKAVILAGGSGTRLYPVTKMINKHFLPVYNKPMIYYPVSLVMLLKIKEIIFVINPEDEQLYSKLFSYLEKLGMKINFVLQENPNGLAEGLVLSEKYISGSPVMYMLGDNILYGHSVWQVLMGAKNEIEKNGGAYTFCYYVKDPERFGVVGLMIGCIEKIGYRNGWITKDQLLELAKPLKKTEYRKYLLKLAKEEEHAFSV